MNDIFKADALLYLAFIASGLVSVVETWQEKLIVIGVSVAIIVIRSVIKKFVYKD